MRRRQRCTPRTSGRCAPRHSSQLATRPSSLVDELAAQLAPSLGEDRAVKAGLVSDVAARQLVRAARRTGQVPTLRSSITTRPWLLARSVESLCRKSLRMRACRADSLAIWRRTLRWRLLVLRRARRRAVSWRPARRRSRRSRRFCPGGRSGQRRSSPVESATVAATPRSTPTGAPAWRGGDAT